MFEAGSKFPRSPPPNDEGPIQTPPGSGAPPSRPNKETIDVPAHKETTESDPAKATGKPTMFTVAVSGQPIEDVPIT